MDGCSSKCTIPISHTHLKPASSTEKLMKPNIQNKSKLSNKRKFRHKKSVQCDTVIGSTLIYKVIIYVYFSLICLIGLVSKYLKILQNYLGSRIGQNTEFKFTCSSTTRPMNLGKTTTSKSTISKLGELTSSRPATSKLSSSLDTRLSNLESLHPSLSVSSSTTTLSSASRSPIAISPSTMSETCKSPNTMFTTIGSPKQPLPPKLSSSRQATTPFSHSIFTLYLVLLCSCVGLSTAQERRTSPQNVMTTVEGGGWLLNNLLSMPSECDMEGDLAPCSFILTCLIQGGFPVNKCGGGYIYTCCVPGGRSANVRSDALRTGLSLRHIDRFIRDNAPIGGHHQSKDYQNSLPPFSESFPGEEGLDDMQSFPPSAPHINSNSLDDRRETDRHRRQRLVRGNKQHTDVIYYNEPECGVQPPMPSNVLMKRIIGGQEAHFAELPWQAHIRIAGYQCGGVLVNRYYVATAAHCVHKANLRQITIHLGEFDTKDTGRYYEPLPKESFSVVEKRTHPNFKYMLTQPDRFDVAVLRLSRPVEYRPNIVPICLPAPGNHLHGKMGIVAGWGKIDNSYGKTGTNILRKVNVPIIENEECLRWHHLKHIDVKLHYEMFCAGHPQGKMDACLGDSGGPIVVNNKGRWTLAGITSAGFGCAVDHQPGIYHKVAITSGWIAANIRP